MIPTKVVPIGKWIASSTSRNPNKRSSLALFPFSCPSYANEDTSWEKSMIHRTLSYANLLSFNNCRMCLPHGYLRIIWSSMFVFYLTSKDRFLRKAIQPLSVSLTL
ncbi:hypothetical protein NPIL_630041 [Nephila pilipes]|uniref:Uncharacterized protein n=1 Tax=Nephila pilipes TaxID=299642 RepID=A0A8X6UQS4_NEPPI|nr:hypothetical protein NPIL_630041 [Nephila pilipes]